jgi:HD domain
VFFAIKDDSPPPIRSPLLQASTTKSPNTFAPRRTIVPPSNLRETWYRGELRVDRSTDNLLAPSPSTLAALLHDIGKIGVPDAILRKPSQLTAEERAIINRHPEYSWSILRLFSGLEQASLYALHHHENTNGTGYPAGLKGPDIPLVSRIISVIDAYDAMVSNRCYRPGLPHCEAISRLLQSSGTQFDPEVVKVFIPIAEKDAADVFAAAGTSMAAVL